MMPKVIKAYMEGLIETVKEYCRSCHGVMRTPFVCTLHLPPDKNKISLESQVCTIKEHTAENEIYNRTIYDILDQIYEDTDLYPYIKQWIGPNNVNATA